jgi:tRNA pseudouridine55 synthase
MDGILLLNKPIAWTSHDLVDEVRRRLKTRRVGHTGTLDPMATGLMILLVGKETKRASEFMGMDKSYRGSFRLGVRTDTWDLDGRVLEESPSDLVSTEELETIFSGFYGEQEMTPPIFSALRRNGQKAYALARRGQPVVMEPRSVMIHAFKIEAFDPPEVYFYLSCSKGTYVRSLGHLIGEKLGCGATLSSLIRIRIGDYYLKDAQSLESLS